MLLFKIDKETKKFTGFYDDEIHNVKTDDVEYFEITKNKHSELLENQSKGGEIYWNGEELIALSKPLIPDEIISPIFNYETLMWEEGATPEEIANKYISFYKSEKEVYELIKLDNELGFVTEDELIPCREYLKAINPYHQTSKLSIITRPSIFDKYKTL